MKKGEIFNVNLIGRGHEQKGFRPAIVYSSVIAGIVAIIPLTSIEKALKYDGSLKIIKSNTNGLNSDSVALIFHIKTIDARFLKNKIGELDEKNLHLINNKLREFLDLK
ncbi:MAG: PemK-like protein [archaeon GW2011_AR13]|nr:MAG: PemK-like protein [archaeon GW2011_AR13]HIG94184.1 type II toxin-antitoxin system PemK/MazF family toxin [Nanoarchaeota archaeon]HIH62706.1 type II toxin-antitoxin system PemK/MazF family toxin [Nanoarchaeota archaeon]HIJ09912.1 type II toxin-antitoxin system PemK/MazF family toxin [Nanoarchaeota archaeon]